jgi:hypothetical protein
MLVVAGKRRILPKRECELYTSSLHKYRKDYCLSELFPLWHGRLSIRVIPVPLATTALPRYRDVSWASQWYCLLPKDKTVQYNWRFSKLKGTSHSVIITAFPLVFQSPYKERKNPRLDPPLPETYHYPFNSTTIPLLNNKKEFYGEGLGTIWIGNRT